MKSVSPDEEHIDTVWGSAIVYNYMRERKLGLYLFFTVFFVYLRNFYSFV